MPWLGETNPSCVHDWNDTQHSIPHPWLGKFIHTFTPPKNNYLIRERSFQTTSKNTSRTHTSKQTNSVFFSSQKKQQLVCVFSHFLIFFVPSEVCATCNKRTLQSGRAKSCHQLKPRCFTSPKPTAKPLGFVRAKWCMGHGTRHQVCRKNLDHLNTCGMNFGWVLTHPSKTNNQWHWLFYSQFGLKNDIGCNSNWR